MNDLDEYMELIVEPTFADFSRNARSFRHAYLTCVAIYHAVDHAEYPNEPATLAEQWRSRIVWPLCSLTKWLNISSTAHDDGLRKQKKKITMRYLLRIP